MSLQIPGLYIMENEKGRAVFTARPIQKGDIIEICPVILIPESQISAIDKTIIYEYYFLWGKDQKDAALPLGLGGLYNHSFTPNASTIQNLDDNEIHFIAERDIEAHEEIMIDYTAGEKSVKLWFKTH